MTNAQNRKYKKIENFNKTNEMIIKEDEIKHINNKAPIKLDKILLENLKVTTFNFQINKEKISKDVKLIKIESLENATLVKLEAKTYFIIEAFVLKKEYRNNNRNHYTIMKLNDKAFNQFSKNQKLLLTKLSQQFMTQLECKLNHTIKYKLINYS